LDACPICGALRYKIRRDNPWEVEGEHPRKRVPAKVMWYSPIIPYLKHLFRNKDHVKMMRWHKEEWKQDTRLRHLADGSQWRKIDRTYPDFALDARNIRFPLSTDGMNPWVVFTTLGLWLYVYTISHHDFAWSKNSSWCRCLSRAQSNLVTTLMCT
jgi:hypothetical protein